MKYGRMDPHHGKTGPMNNKLLLGYCILVTGHTGFKGSWLTLMLESLGAEVYGYSLPPEKNSIFGSFPIDTTVNSKFGDIRDFKEVCSYIEIVRPDFIIHLAAQSLVIESYRDPLTTFQTNVIGTANILESLRHIESVLGVIVVTSDKVYTPTSVDFAHSEGSQLGGSEPYGASKAAAELVVNSWRSVIKDSTIRLITARAGNVIGGGDISHNRLIPDIFRAYRQNTTIEIRNPASIRPWQHVLEPIFGYVKILLQIIGKKPLSNTYNFGPSLNSNKTVEDVLVTTKRLWPQCPNWIISNTDIPETNKLSINSSLAKTELGWENILQFEEAIKLTIEWELDLSNKSAHELTKHQIYKYLERAL